jgi:lysyl-tRNA synthetase class 2
MADFPGDCDFGPTASLAMLRLRADMMDWLRGYFRKHGYWEVETPLLSHDVCVDAWLEPFRVPAETAGIGDLLFLQTSPEFGMKRLVAAGADAIFQITRAFRREELGRLHNPEFTIVEWYRVGDTCIDQMTFVEQLVTEFWVHLSDRCPRTASDSVSGESCTPDVRTCPSRPFSRMTYDEVFARALGQAGVSSTASELAHLARTRQLAAPRSLEPDNRDGWLNLLFAEAVEPMLAHEEAVFITDYPASQAALARIRPEDPPVAERFELFLRGIEICNGYQELTDPEELRRRFAAQLQLRERAGRPPLPADSRLLQAMDAGLPECAGVSLGFDRLLMTFSGARSINEVLAFPFDRA